MYAVVTTRRVRDEDTGEWEYAIDKLLQLFGNEQDAMDAREFYTRFESDSVDVVWADHMLLPNELV